MTENNFYREFEDRHRGSRDLIKGRLNIYKQFIEPLLDIEKNPRALDLGCGRGEWLEILGEMGVAAVGVDLDQGMLAACAERGLIGIHGDAIEYISSLESNSQLVVSAFHVVEHISFESLQKLTEEAYRVLQPGGVLILETPNPENIYVSTCNFYLDPSHIKPIPPDLLFFIAKYCGFARANIVRLQESPQVLHSQGLTLNDVLGGASPDYAIVAQKEASQEVFSLCDGAFERNFGINSIELAARYSHQLDQKIEGIRIQAQRVADEMAAIHSSYIWRITAPLRWVEVQTRKVRQEGLRARTKAFLVKSLVYTPLFGEMLLNRESNARGKIISLSRKLGLYSLLRRMHIFVLGSSNSSHAEDEANHFPAITSVEDLDPEAKKIYLQLKDVASPKEFKD